MTTTGSLFDLVRPELDEVEMQLIATAQAEHPLLGPMLSMVLPGAGKRVRPALALLACVAAGFLGRALPPVAPLVQAMWPPAGVAIAILLRIGRPRPVSISDDDVAVGRDCARGWTDEGGTAVSLRDTRLAKRQQHLAVGAELEHLMALAAAAEAVDGPHVALAVHVNAMRKQHQARAEALEQLSGLIELEDWIEVRAATAAGSGLRSARCRAGRRPRRCPLGRAR